MLWLANWHFRPSYCTCFCNAATCQYRHDGTINVFISVSPSRFPAVAQRVASLHHCDLDSVRYGRIVRLMLAVREGQAQCVLAHRQVQGCLSLPFAEVAVFVI